KRVDYYKLDPTMDNIFAEDNPGVAVEGLTETSVSPKLGGIWRFNDQWSLFGNYAHGFRSPPYGDVNVGFTNLVGGYTVIANPDLKPETSDGFELGLRFANEAVYAGLTGYYNDYKDFIESFVFTGFNDAGLMVFQSQNVSDARIYGAEFKAGVDFGAVNEALDGLSLRGPQVRGNPGHLVLPWIASLTLAIRAPYSLSAPIISRAISPEVIGLRSPSPAPVPSALAPPSPSRGLVSTSLPSSRSAPTLQFWRPPISSTTLLRSAVSALRWVILSICSSVRRCVVSNRRSGQLGHSVSECG
ncbi:MAG: TonB-dependent receptor, partial [Hyphomicrobiales bacterium]